MQNIVHTAVINSAGAGQNGSLDILAGDQRTQKIQAAIQNGRVMVKLEQLRAIPPRQLVPARDKSANQRAARQF